MKIIEKYTGTKTYMFPNGVIATPQKVIEQFPAALTFTHIVETDESGEVMWAMQNLSAMRSMYNISRDFSEEEAIQKIQEIVNKETEQLSVDPMERIAAAIEFQNLMSLNDVE